MQDQKLQVRHNSFDFARFLAATAVIFSHHFPITGFTEPRYFGFTFGGIAVDVFFLISGYLIAKSVLSKPDIHRFLAARLLRILPNLIFMLVVTAAVTLIVFANFDQIESYFVYVAQNLLMLVRGGPFYIIPGVFEGRPEQAMNGSIWSLPYEVWCYFILFAVLVFRHGYRATTICVIIAVSWAAALLVDWKLPGTGINLGNLGKLAVPFFIGALFAVLGKPIPLVSSGRMAWFSKGGDPSYGMYIFAWPAQQYSTLLIGDFWLSMVTAFAVATALGYFTWHTFEKRALDNVETLAGFFRRMNTRAGQS